MPKAMISQKQIKTGLTGAPGEYIIDTSEKEFLGMCGIKDLLIVNLDLPDIDAGCAIKYAGNTIIYNHSKNKCFHLSGRMVTNEVFNDKITCKISEFAIKELGKNPKIFNFAPMVFVNGILQREKFDYEIEGEKIIFSCNPHEHDAIQIVWS